MLMGRFCQPHHFVASVPLAASSGELLVPAECQSLPVQEPLGKAPFLLHVKCKGDAEKQFQAGNICLLYTCTINCPQ